MPELRRVLPDLEVADGELEGSAMLDRALAVARSRQQLNCPPLVGHLPLAVPAHRGPAAAVRRMYGRMPWTTPRKDAYRAMSVPVGGEGGVRNPNWPPPSRPEDEDIEIRPDQRAGASPTLSGAPGRKASSPITLRFLSESTQPTVGHSLPFPRTCVDGSKNTLIVR